MQKAWKIEITFVSLHQEIKQFTNKKTFFIMALFIFGWVSPQVTCNFAAWAIAIEEGTAQQAEQFRLDTIGYYPNEDWFCIQKEEYLHSKRVRGFM